MIRVDRNREENGVTIRPSETWFRKAKKETEKAIEEGPEHQVGQLYKDVEVKKALEKLFYDKCAYCETRLISGDWEVEHYRPKGRIAGRSDHPGYYWLAYTWENLYPACTFCNQMRKDAPRFDEPEELPAQGKQDQFPLEKEDNRAKNPGDDLSKENPLLLSPCDDDPEKHFTYDIHGQISPIEDNDLRAKETIRVCNLRRRRLRDDRARTIIRVCKLIKTIALAREANNREVEAELNSLLEDFTGPSSIYAGAARTVKRNPLAFG
jgi:uncharacterized protein (TIGR02646 family)